eukprot:2938520-Ditylum_brightwellii.AAC.1
MADNTKVAVPNSATFYSYVTNLPDHEGNVSIASDGSVATKRGYYAVVLHTETEILRFQGPCNGAPAL